MGRGDRLKELATLEGFAGAALFSPAGELLAAHGAERQLEGVGSLANTLLQNAQRASLGMGTGRGQLVHVAGDKAHVLVRCLNEGTDPLASQPGKAHLHLVVLLSVETSVGAAKVRMTSTLQELAEEFRG